MPRENYRLVERFEYKVNRHFKICSVISLISLIDLTQYIIIYHTRVNNGYSRWKPSRKLLSTFTKYIPARKQRPRVVTSVVVNELYRLRLCLTVRELHWGTYRRTDVQTAWAGLNWGSTSVFIFCLWVDCVLRRCCREEFEEFPILRAH